MVKSDCQELLRSPIHIHNCKDLDQNSYFWGKSYHINSISSCLIGTNSVIEYFESTFVLLEMVCA